ncbi:TPA: hydrogenase, partial [Candidatus Bathyarchaeota archaeon]|nr:hydrogenase [Candidatus Bathyarchaeota archaeon]
MPLETGKFPREVLEEIVFKHLGVPDGDVVLGPTFGEDAAIVRVADRLFAIACDPITGAERWVGWLAVNASANDVAVQGVRPRWFVSCILLPRGADRPLVARICEQIDEACRRLSMRVIGGHAEITPGLTHPVVIGTSIGVTSGGFITSSGARVGDRIVMTKGAGIEGTAIIASDLRERLRPKLGDPFLDEAESFFYKVSVVDEALTASSLGATAMHDPTEGGIAGGLHELADASGVGFRVRGRELFVHPITSRLCRLLSIDPLGLISSGTLLATARPGDAQRIVEELKAGGTFAAVIGQITPGSEGRLVE